MAARTSHITVPDRHHEDRQQGLERDDSTVERREQDHQRARGPRIFRSLESSPPDPEDAPSLPCFPLSSRRTPSIEPQRTMVHSLSNRYAQLAQCESVKRSLYLASAIGIVSLVATCVVLLPWKILYTQGHWVAFAFLAGSSFVWSAMPIAALSYADQRKSLQGVLGFLSFTAVGAAILMIFLQYQLVTRKDEQRDHCLDKNPENTSEWCSARIHALTIALPIVLSFLPVSSLISLSLLRTDISRLPSSSSSSASNPYATLNPLEDDLPPNWDVPPDRYAPDSSASDDDDVDDDDGSSDGGRSRRAYDSNRYRKRETVGSWYELGKKTRPETSRPLRDGGIRQARDDTKRIGS
ncbi:hypothetical protein JCM10212_001977 [Sporobolomyces blumeae]